MSSPSTSPIVGEDGYFLPPFSLNPMSDDMRLGLIAPAFAGLLSAFATLSLIGFITFRIIAWRRHYRTFIGYNQYVMLVLNLLIADLQQASAFLISWYWITEDKILSPTPACFAQGWLLHSGDVSSALFVLAIAVHTFMTAIMNVTIGHRLFYGAILVLWFLAYFLTFLGVAMHPGTYFVRAGAWCWVSSEYENERLFLHYFWVFLVEFTTICLYAITFFALRIRTRRTFRKFKEELDSTSPKTVEQVNRVTMLMTLYPCVYIILTLPLSSGRMWTMAHNGESTSTSFSCAAGALLASCGWVDALLYTLTRKRLLNETMPSHYDEHDGLGLTALRTVSITGHNTNPGTAIDMNRFMKNHDPNAIFVGAHNFGTSTIVTAGPSEMKSSLEEERSEKSSIRVAFREVLDDGSGEDRTGKNGYKTMDVKEFLDQGPKVRFSKPPKTQSKLFSWPWRKQ